jgi:type I restriction enzyme R subunit
MTKEAQARIKINKPLEAAGWRFFEDASGPASIVLEAKVKCAIHRVWGESAKPA